MDKLRGVIEATMLLQYRRSCVDKISTFHIPHTLYYVVLVVI